MSRLTDSITKLEILWGYRDGWNGKKSKAITIDTYEMGLNVLMSHETIIRMHRIKDTHLKMFPMVEGGLAFEAEYTHNFIEIHVSNGCESISVLYGNNERERDCDHLHINDLSNLFKRLYNID